MWSLRDWYDEITLGKGHRDKGPNNLEYVIVNGLKGNESLKLGRNPHSDLIFKTLLSDEPAFRDLVQIFMRALPEEDRPKVQWAMQMRTSVSIVLPPNLSEMAMLVSAYYCRNTPVLDNFASLNLAQYTASRDTPARKELHDRYVRQYVPDLHPRFAPWFSVPNMRLSKGTPQPRYQNSFNPAFQIFQEYFCEPAQFAGRDDPSYFGMMISTYGRRGQIVKVLCNQIFTYAIPCDNVLRYMTDAAKGKQIAEVGAGNGYWCLLLSKYGAKCVANDIAPSGNFFPIVSMDAEKFIRDNGGLADKIIFFCWPRGELSPGEAVCMPERCLNIYKGNDIYFVGEIDNGCTFDMQAWVKAHPGWRLAKSLPIPNFLGTDDKFYHYQRVVVAPPSQPSHPPQ
eukprot:TRINITY_DN2185_c0_g1_i2.p1 TRINITY_DN2185_c0_g1~~TRINITY_DN2185_c0_g1_i2.p1  ORF type:complete len:450 (-),score=89.57 TRINITY_DN2185_c0_g1_i2:170-1357(-)